MENVVLLAGEVHADEGGFPAAGWGIGVFIVLMLLLTITLMFGKGRPHA